MIIAKMEEIYFEDNGNRAYLVKPTLMTRLFNRPIIVSMVQSDEEILEEVRK